jgi:hypothetical protein
LAIVATFIVGVIAGTITGAIVGAFAGAIAITGLTGFIGAAAIGWAQALMGNSSITAKIAIRLMSLSFVF